MRIFLTGATGFIGSAIIPEFLNAGHQVLGLTRSDAGAAALLAAGAEVHRGELSDLDSLRAGAANSDGVIHCAFNHDAFTTLDFSKFAENCASDKLAIDAIGSVLAGSNRPLIVSAGLGAWTPGHPVTEDLDHPANSPLPRVSEQAAIALASQGVNTAVVRLPQVHDPVKQGLVTYLVAVARQKGQSAYIAEGLNRWPAAHVLDVAHLYRLAFEKLATGEHPAGSKYHAVAEQGVPLRDIAEALGRGLKIPVISLSPEEAPANFGWLAGFVGYDIPASSALTQQRLGWNPTGPTMLADLAAMDYRQP